MHVALGRVTWFHLIRRQSGSYPSHRPVENGVNCGILPFHSLTLPATGYRVKTCNGLFSTVTALQRCFLQTRDHDHN
jgi:hypothetical protein